LADWLDIAPLGVGATYSSALEPLIERHPELFDLLEIEPQTGWIKTADPRHPFKQDDALLDHINALPGRKIIHSVGRPVGGTVAPDPAELDLLSHAIDRLRAPWASDHLSFNQTSEFATGFFLPPRQTHSGIESAARAIRRLKSALTVPIAVETGVSYLRPRQDELPDGEFVARVVETADCGVLLDLHNVYCNSVNGRQPLDEFLNQLPLERVWEVHVAGGFDMEGFYLDAHSGAIPPPLHSIIEEVVPRLPNLKAIVFEIFPSFIPVVGLDVVREQLEWLRAVWKRCANNEQVRPRPMAISADVETSDRIAPEIWERALGRLVVGKAADDISPQLALELSEEPGVRIVERLIHEFRGSMIVRVLPLTSRFIMLALGTEAFRTILADYWSKVTPQMYASVEAESFAEYMNGLKLKVPHLAKVLEFERATALTNTDGVARVVQFDFEPMPMLRAIAECRHPEEPPPITAGSALSCDSSS